MANFKILSVITTTLSTVGFCLATYAWNFNGHVLVATIAFNHLTESTKIACNRNADYIFSKLGRRQRLKLEKEYPDANSFERVAVLPDQWRGKTLQQIFRRFRAPLPQSLSQFRNKTTEHWHFTNQPYPHTYCNVNHKHDIVWAINQLEYAWHDTQDWQSQAVIQVFLEHLIGDAHQPLHTITHVNLLCSSDYGGNRYFVRGINDEDSNLHKIWDQGVGYLAQRIKVTQKAQQLEKEFPSIFFSAKQLNENKPLDWIQTNPETLQFIYSIPYNGTIPDSYYKDSQKIVHTQLALAGYRLAQVLNADAVGIQNSDKLSQDYNNQNLSLPEIRALYTKSSHLYAKKLRKNLKRLNHNYSIL